jgi:hypothetical protein
MPSEKELKAIKDRQDAEREVNREQQAKLKKAEEAEREQRRLQKNRYLQPDLSFDEMFKQSCARVYYMKSRKLEYTTPGTPAWEIPKVADKLLSRFKYSKKHADQAEVMVQAAIRNGNQKQIEEYKAESDKHLTKCLHSHYGIGVLYGEFLTTARPVTIVNPE